MEGLSAELALCEGNHRLTVDFPHKRAIGAELWFILCKHEQDTDRTVELLSEIWDARLQVHTLETIARDGTADAVPSEMYWRNRWRVLCTAMCAE